jgi:hypothetical protein
MKNNLYLLLLPLIFSGCCNDMLSIISEGIECREEVFTETKKIDLKLKYTVSENNKFIIADSISAERIRKALDVPQEKFTVKQIEMTSGNIVYQKHEDNRAAAVLVSFAIVGNTFGQLLLTGKDIPLPLSDIPAIPFVTDGVKINEFFDKEGIKGIKEILRDYATLANNEGVSFLLLGESQPVALDLLAHFTLYFNMNITIVYEVCKLVPLGTGERVCE